MGMGVYRTRESYAKAPPSPTSTLTAGRTADADSQRPLDLTGHGHGGLSDARVTREGPTIANVYIDISPFYGMAPATVSGYRSGGRRYA